MEFIITDKQGSEEGYLIYKGIDIDVGGENDFEIDIDINSYDEKIHGYGCMFFKSGTEYGGIIRNHNPVTKDQVVKLGGSTWRGILNQKALEPLPGQNYRILNGEANTVIAGLISEFGLADLFSVSTNDSGFSFDNYQCKLQRMFVDEVSDALNEMGARLDISYIKGPPNGIGYVLLEVTAITDYTDSEAFSQDSNTNVDVMDYRDGVNHLICLGKGELSARTRVDLYAWPDGSIKKERYYTGLDQHDEYYEYSSAEDVATLESYGRKRLLDEMNYQQLKVSVENAEYLKLADIIPGRDWITGISAKVPVVQIIVQVDSNGKTKITPKLKGES